MAERRIVVITGASGGIGAALARSLGAAGDAVVLGARRADELDVVARASGAEAMAVVTDVTRRTDVERLRDRAIARFGHIDVWVNNAGRGISRSVMELTDEDLDEMMSVNVKSALYGMQAVVPHFVERRAGHVVNVSSFLGRVPMAAVRSAYGAAKAALNALTANLRTELRAHPNIHVSLVMPGPVSTDFALNALGATTGPAAPRGAIPAQTAQEIAEILVRVLDAPRAETITSPVLEVLRERYFADIDAFEAGLARGFVPVGPAGSGAESR